MTFEQFSPIFATLAMQLRAQDVTEITARGYFKALSDLEPEFVAMAATRLATSAEWFPKTSEWLALARKIEREREDQLKALLRKLPEPLCVACEDTSWDRTKGVVVVPCACRKLRRLEVLGRRPMPELPPASEVA